MSTGLTTEQLEYLFREYVKEVWDDHLYDASRQLSWYTGFRMTGDGTVHEIDRKDGAYSFWRDKPYVEMTEKEYRKLIGQEREEEEVKEPEIIKCSCGETFDWENWDRETWPMPKGIHEAVRHLDMGHTLESTKEKGKR